jgi:hypothetical protein
MNADLLDLLVIALGVAVTFASVLLRASFFVKLF